MASSLSKDDVSDRIRAFKSCFRQPSHLFCASLDLGAMMAKVVAEPIGKGIWLTFDSLRERADVY
jgi:hypothetical protein